MPTKKPTTKKKAASKKPAPKKVPTSEKTASFDKTLPVQLTAEELLHRGDSIAQAMDKKAEVNAKLALAKEEAKGELKKWEDEIRKLQLQLRRKAEDRRVRCHEVKYFDRREAELYREDTAELVSTRALRADELQRHLDLQQKEDTKKKAAAKAKGKTPAKKSTSDKPPGGTDYADTSPAGSFAGSDKGEDIKTTAEAPKKPAAPRRTGAYGSSYPKRGRQ
jgi:hypothetical protein